MNGDARQPLVSFRAVDIVFGDEPQRALPLIDAGRTRSEIHAQTGQIVGVKQASLDVFEGEIVVLMGLSGSGKSTLVRAVNGLNAVTRGQVLVRDGAETVDVHGCGARRLRALRRRRIAMVFQQFALLPWRSVSDNVALGLELDGMARSRRGERVARQLDLVGLSGWGDKKVNELSGGMQQRVGLARAFATEAPLLLMDEPFSALDPLIRVRLQDELLALQRQLDRTMIFVSHDLDEALKIGTRIAIMEGGSIVQVGSPQEIVLRPSCDYVREFVAHMNPLNVLRAREVMTPLASPPAEVDGRVRVSEELAASRQGQAWRDGEEAVCIPLDRIGSAPPGAFVSVGCATPLRALIEARLKHAGPFLVEEDGRITGRISDEDLFGCLTGRETRKGAII
ncbi:choline ABC transporter ATP-binding protein [Faunimonas sp. B44]|uniref:choline ABC transporter ATP-binding protein n=1 Tax=Faunimonas sp. B44 TaxID=3461493 RepID=UPI004044A55D